MPDEEITTEVVEEVPTDTGETFGEEAEEVLDDDPGDPQEDTPTPESDVAPDPTPRTRPAYATGDIGTSGLADDERTALLARLGDGSAEDWLAAIEEVSGRIARRMAQQEVASSRVFETNLRAAGATDQFSSEFGNEIRDAQSYMDPTFRATPQGAHMAMAAAIQARIANGADAGETYALAAKCMTPAKKTTQVTPPVRASGPPVARGTARVAAPARRTTTEDYLAKRYGMDKDKVAAALEELGG